MLLEVGNYLSRAADKPKFTHLVETILQDPAIRVIAATSELLNAGYDLYKRRLDKDWSLTDCISFVVMQREGLTDALTTDKHFEQAGFKKLLD